jgi:autophagy-related protein 2
VPWPNPLVSTLGLSLSSLNLVFHVVPSPPVLNPDVDLTASVASVAESFIHEELSPREAVAFWQTLHPTTQSPSDIEEQAIPGGLDTINTTDDRHKLDMDPEGVSVFATLIERLLARFEFDVQDVTVTLVHPGNMSLTLFLEEIRYQTISKDTNLSSSGGESRTLSINGCHLAASNLDSNIPFPSTASPSATSASPSTSRPLSRISSSSSIDEETQFAMSQSLAFLPPKADPLSISTSSSMYQSALSRTFLDPLDEISEAIPEGNLDPWSIEAPLNVPISTTRKDNRLLSFGSLPIDIQLTTPSPVAKASNDDPFLPYAEDEIYSDEILQVTVSMGIVACALRPWHINGLLLLIQSLDRHHQKASEVDAESFGKSSTLCSIPLRIHTQLRGLVLLLLSSPRSVHSPMTDSLENFFDRCLVPPPLDCGYTRIHLDGLTASLVCSTHQKQDSEASGSPTSNTEINSSSLSLEFAIADMSIFFFSRPPFENKSSQLSAFPLLLTDPHLATQYPTSHNHPQGNGSYCHLPIFDIIDWTEENCQSFGTRLSAWRVRLPKHGA